MKLSKLFIVCGLIAGGMAPVAIALNQPQEYCEVKADTTKDLADIISAGNRAFEMNAIGDFFFDFNLSEQIFTNSSYVNDHLNEFLDENNQPINLGEGIIINGKTLKYWIDYSDSGFTYPRNDGIHLFPLAAGTKFAPVAVQISTDKIAFKVHLNYLPMDSILVTFKAGVFKGYYNGTKFTLSEDLTFYSTLTDTYTSSNAGKVVFVRERNEVLINPKITSVNDWGEHTSEKGGKYHRYVLFTNAPRNQTMVPDAYPATHYRYIFDNYLVNDKPLTYYNCWVRGNSKDFTNLNDPSTIQADYETEHPGGSVSVNECLPLYLQFANDQDNYVCFINVPNQLKTDFSITNLEFSLRDGSVWYTKDENNNPIIGRYDSAAFSNFVHAAISDFEDSIDLGVYDDNDRAEVINIMSAAEQDVWEAFSEVGVNKILADAKTAIDNFISRAQKHINEVIALIDAIPSTITYTSECGAAIKAAMEAYANLTEEERAAFPAAKLLQLYDAYEEFYGLDLANYKALSKAEITAKVDLNAYREVERSGVETLIAQVFNIIDLADTKEEVQNAVNGFYMVLPHYLTDAQLTAQELATAKTNAKAELDAIDLSVYRDEERAQVQELITNGKVAIDQCETIDEVATLLNKIKTVIASIKTDADLNNEQGALVTTKTQQQSILIAAIIASSFTLFVGVGLSIFFIRRRKAKQ